MTRVFGGRYMVMIDKDLLNKIIENCRSFGHDIKMRDVCFVILGNYFSDKDHVFRCLFDPTGKMSREDSERYISSSRIAFLAEHIKPYIENKQKQKKQSGEEISFEENLAYMLNIKKETEEAMRNKEMDKKDALKILADITVKLNDKFNIVEETKEQMVVVNTKFNNICECGREIYIPTKEDLIKEYNLVENEK
jgi:hypothetical protein